MHELTVTQSILDIALEHAAKANASRIGRINLVIGDSAGIVEECVSFYFEMLSAETIASGALLSFDRVPLRARCSECGATFPLDELEWSCPRCRGGALEIVAGRELYVDSIEVE